jgi:hypothetical protein
VEKDRQVSLEKGSYVRVDHVNDIKVIPDDGLVVYLKEFGKVRLFRHVLV